MNSLKEKIKFIKKYDKEYLVHPVAALQDVKHFEKKFKLKLPDDYRDFILNVTNGIDNIKWDETIFIKTNFVDDLIHPSHENFNPSIEFPATERTFPSIVKTRDSKSKFHYDQLTNGNIPIKSAKCGRGILLIVKGKAKSQVWGEYMSSNAEFFPWYGDDHSENSFSRWINEELDNILARIKNAKNESKGKLLRKIKSFISNK